MKIWLINHYAVPTKYYPLSRPANFAKYLMEAGHEVTIFAASTVHNSDINLINDGSLYKEDYVDGIHYVYIKASDYFGNGLKRIINMFEFPLRLPKVCKKFPKPDAILATSVTPMACKAGIKLSKKYGCIGVAEIADLWPETFVAYGLLSNKNPLMKILYLYEKRLYEMADSIVFTMEGGIDYIKGHKWDIESGGKIDKNKIYHINNGVDLEAYNNNITEFTLSDSELNDSNTFKVIYVGSVRKVNGLETVVKTAELLKDNKDLKFIIYGEGDERQSLTQMCEELGLSNIYFKGAVDKKYIPYVLSKSNLNLIHVVATPIMKFGCSLNKLFDYFASEKPIVSDLPVAYDLIEKYGAGITLEKQTPEDLANAIKQLYNCPEEEYAKMCQASKRAAEEHDFKALTQKLLKVFDNCQKFKGKL